MPKSFQPFLIADFKTGLLLNKEPWRLPAEAFTNIDNAYVSQGTLTKRLGFREHSRFATYTEQDFLADYTDVDVGADRVTLTDTKCTWADAHNDEEIYTYKDFGAAYFDGELTHEFKLILTAQEAGSYHTCWGLGNLADDFLGIETNAK